MEDGDYELVDSNRRNDNKYATPNTERIATTTIDHSSVAKNKWTGKTFAIVLVTLIVAFAILVFAVIVAMVIFNPQTRDSNSEIETLKQQVETLGQKVEYLRMTVSQIQQSNWSSLQGSISEEILRQGIQETIENVIHEHQLQVNISQRSIQELEKEVQNSKKMLENTTENLTSLTQNIEAIMDELENSVGIKFAQFELWLNTTGAGINLEVETLSKKFATDIQTLGLEVQANNITIYQEIEKRLEDLKIEELQSVTNTTNILLSNVMESVTETLALELNRVESQINFTHGKFNNHLAELSEKIETVNQQLEAQINVMESKTENLALELNGVESHINFTHGKFNNRLAELSENVQAVNQQLEAQINQTQSNIDKINLDISETLMNATTLSVVRINQLRHQTNKSIKTVELHFADAIYDLEQRVNQSQGK